MKTPVIKTTRLLLDQVCDNDANDIYEYASNPKVSKWVTFDTHKSLNDTFGFLRFLESRPGNDFTWAVRLSQCKKLIGTIDFCASSEDKAADLHYCLSDKYWNQGIVTEAAKAVLSWGLNQYETIEKVVSGAVSLNVGSIRVLEKCGFFPVEIRKEKWDKYAGEIEFTVYELDAKIYRKPVFHADANAPLE
ncbi:acetyltransferase, GNAT family [Chitinispirillum alkaliphilum]|nr:acetyltransferase, GNAT family [Chitinispirillum alkaliphilum]